GGEPALGAEDEDAAVGADAGGLHAMVELVSSPVKAVAATFVAASREAVSIASSDEADTAVAGHTWARPVGPPEIDRARAREGGVAAAGFRLTRAIARGGGTAGVEVGVGGEVDIVAAIGVAEHAHDCGPRNKIGEATTGGRFDIEAIQVFG